jgi:hyperosmotically inducible periplasmic protein
MNTRLMTMSAIGAVVASLALAGCNKSDREAAKGSADQTVAQVDQQARQLGNNAKDATRDMVQEAKAGAQQMGDKVEDAAISANVRAEIAKDSELQAAQVSVDTADGRVALRGSAPSAAARERATSLAARVRGVESVENQLIVEAKP